MNKTKHNNTKKRQRREKKTNIIKGTNKEKEVTQKTAEKRKITQMSARLPQVIIKKK